VSIQFAFGSCFRPGKENAGEAFHHLDRSFKDLGFLVLEGDQIYADEFEYNGLGHVALNLEDYRAVYLHTWRNGPLRELLSHTPVFMTLDDHEVDNDWRWLDNENRQPAIPFYTTWIRWFQGRSREERSLSPDRVRAALQAYREHQTLHAPPLLLSDGAQAYTFEYGGCAFFVMDTRSRRVISRKDRSLLGESQFAALSGWLLRVKDDYPVKFIVTSISLLSHQHLDALKCRWSGLNTKAGAC
jgi:alkaline phosphatase D